MLSKGKNPLHRRAKKITAGVAYTGYLLVEVFECTGNYQYIVKLLSFWAYDAG